MLPPYARSREERARVPEPVDYGGRPHDVIGVGPESDLLLRDQCAMHRDMRIECFTGGPAMLDGVCWRVISLEAVTGPSDAVLKLVDPHTAKTRTITGAKTRRVKFPSAKGEHKLGPVKHGIIRMEPVASQATVGISLRPGHRFEARLYDRELEGPYSISVDNGGRLMATGVDRDGSSLQIAISPTEIAPRYKTIESLDFGSSFDVDMFLFCEDQLRSRATSVGADPDGGPIQDPLFGTLPAGEMPLLTNGADHLAVFEDFIRDHAQPDTPSEKPRQLTLLNLSMSNQGDASGVLSALVDFRHQNPNANMTIVVSKLGPTDFQETPEFRTYIDILASNRIFVDTFTGVDGPTRQVMHAKGIVIDHEVLFSTGAVMDTWPINKGDFSIELPPTAAVLFQRYTNEAIRGDATPERRAELAAELASCGVVINDPVAGLTYISRVQDALIRGASRELFVSISELVDPVMTQMLLDRVANGVDVTIQVRELDPVSIKLLMDALVLYPNLRLEDSSWWEPRPHWNTIIADGKTAYLGTSYLWPTQRNMLHQGRSFENGVLLNGDAAVSVRTQIDDLRTRAYSLGIKAPTPFTTGKYVSQSASPLKHQIMLLVSLCGLLTWCLNAAMIPGGHSMYSALLPIAF
ncbi:hypothetical protein G7Z17_g9762 [Cylindrodendrum hubeiense]|uniref:Uncharacterized protein n=1 Tax=Cylindrodendrum hubeiense TaxID=595255 RepID=A0A9P5H782_9HYPO|nr:hypothetical protein G7Z17_g9762 [Cylindrodendrum hubeiense]